MADNPAGTGNTAGGSGASAPDIAQLNTLIQTLTTKISSLEGETKNQRSYHDRQLNDLRVALRRLENVRAQTVADDGYGNQPQPQTRQTPDAYQERLRMQIELTDFKVDQGAAYQKVKDQVDAIINDPVRIHEVVVYNEDGLVDYRKTYRAALREVQFQELAKAQAAGDAAKAEEETKRAAAKRAATISGGVTDEANEGLNIGDVENMTAEEMEEKLPHLFGRSKRVAPVGVARG